MVRNEETTISDFREAVSLQGVKSEKCNKDTVRAGGGSTGMGEDELET